MLSACYVCILSCGILVCVDPSKKISRWMMMMIDFLEKMMAMWPHMHMASLPPVLPQRHTVVCEIDL